MCGGVHQLYERAEYDQFADVGEAFRAFMQTVQKFERSAMQNVVQFVLINCFECCACQQRSFAFQAEESLVLDLQFIEQKEEKEQDPFEMQ